jgi:putative transposase
VIQRAFRYRLEPTAEQAAQLEQFAGVARLVYNLALEQRTNHWRQYRARTGRQFNYASQGLEVTALRREFGWIAEVPIVPLTQALRDLDRAFSNFFSGRAAYPTFRKKARNDGFRLRAIDVRIVRLNRRWSAVRLPKIGCIKFRDTRPMRGEMVNVTITKAANGWHACFAHEIEHVAPANDLPPVGIDRGIANTLALSTGERLSTPDLTQLERRKKRAQRILSRRVRGSNRYRKQRHRLARISAKMVRCRADWQHRAALTVAQRFGAVTLEALQIQNMTSAGRGKRSLNRCILEQGWGAFGRILSYKLEERGGTLIKVNPAYTSQTCSACGAIDKASRESQARFACRHCGFVAHADHNAAINILRRSTPCVEGSGCAPDEALTVNLAA